MKTTARFVVCAGLAFGAALSGCGKGAEPQKQPAPPPPSEQVPNAPAPDNTVKSLPEGQGAGGGAR